MNTPNHSKICFLMRDLHIGGAQRSTLELAKAFSERWEVELLLCRSVGQLLDEVPPNIGVAELKLDRGSRIRPAFGAISSMSTYLRKNQPTIFISGMTSFNMAAVAAARLANYQGKLFLIERNSPSVRTAGTYFFKMAKRIGMKLTYDRADKVFAVSNGAAEDLKSFAWLKNGSVQTIYNPFNIAQIKELASKSKEIALANQGPIIVHSSSMNPVKDPETLIHAFGMIHSKIKANFIIVGGDRDLSFLDPIFRRYDGLKDNTIFAGWTANPYPYIAIADVFVLTSKAEGLPRVIVESMALGVPIVSTDCPSGPHELLKGGDLGRLVPVGDSKAVSDAVLATIDQSDDAKRTLSEKLKSHANTFDSSVIQSQWAKAMGIQT